MTAAGLKIGAVAKQFGLGQDALRFYEKKGLVAASAHSEGGYRLYSPSDLEQLRFVLRAKAVGFTLAEIAELLALKVSRDDVHCADVKQRVDAKLADVAHRLRELQEFQRSLQTLSDACCGGDEPATHCTILDALSAQEDT